MFKFLAKSYSSSGGLVSSQLFDQTTFYQAFIRDLNTCKSEVIIESPFITSNRAASLLPIFSKMRSRGVKIIINTRQPSEHEPPYDYQANSVIDQLQSIGVQVLFTGGHHRKLAIIDRQVLWEGSLNILSQNDSCEIMRRMDSVKIAEQTIDFIRISAFLR